LQQRRFDVLPAAGSFAARSAALTPSAARYAVEILGAGVAVKTGPLRSNQCRSLAAIGRRTEEVAAGDVVG
jgi:hypothetical protein